MFSQLVYTWICYLRGCSLERHSRIEKKSLNTLQNDALGCRANWHRGKCTQSVYEPLNPLCIRFFFISPPIPWRFFCSFKNYAASIYEAKLNRARARVHIHARELGHLCPRFAGCFIDRGVRVTRYYYSVVRAGSRWLLCRFICNSSRTWSEHLPLSLCSRFLQQTDRINNQARKSRKILCIF